MQLLTPSGFDELIDLVPCIHCTKIEEFHNWAGILELRRVIWWRGKLLEHFSANASGRLFSLEHWAIPKITLNKQDHFVVPY